MPSRTTTQTLPHATLAALAADPATPVLKPVVGGDPLAVHLSVPHVERLVLWAGISGLDPRTRVEGGERLPTPVNPAHPGATDITCGVDPLRRPADITEGCGWGLALTAPGSEPVDVELYDSGQVYRRGTSSEQSAAWKRANTAQLAARAEQLRRDDPPRALLADLARAKAERDRAQHDVDEADAAFRSAIRAAVAAHQDGALPSGTTVDDIARIAGITRTRVYQIRDGRR